MLYLPRKPPAVKAIAKTKDGHVLHEKNGVKRLKIFLFMFKSFGKLPSGARLDKIKRSVNYKNGAFQNLHDTPMLAAGESYPKLIKNALNKPADVKPAKPLPSIKTDLNNLAAEKPTIIWFGHSSYFIRSGKTTILVDPVFSGNASPVSLFAKAFPGADAYSAADMPKIDILILTHDHYDHLDYKTIVELKDKVKHFYVSLGVGSHLEYWGVKAADITEFDWDDSCQVTDKIQLRAMPARHFSGRLFKRGQSLWASYILQIDGYTIFIGGDSGYDTHFKEIGEQYGPFDIAILECGQYDKAWPYIHMMPEEVVTAAIELNAKWLLPVHWAKFDLANHAWDDPAKRVTKAAKEQNLNITTPMIGEPVVLDTAYPAKPWWESL